MYAKLNLMGDWRFYDSDNSPTLIVDQSDHIEYYLMSGEKYYSYGEVKRIVRAIAPALGRTQKEILEDIGEPDRFAPNPKYEGARSMKLSLIHI